eukprot:TRINITY_DN12991_c0_g1_i1.p1 TRINITY_DN12991_c0_g1~~TRINITY_DN12991_c0_g1_i1.p1  ORF type:complete len:505 (+),score=61.75 TRINITY_DN12991_c0_g1_i1:40-1515(+)
MGRTATRILGLSIVGLSLLFLAVFVTGDSVGEYNTRVEPTLATRLKDADFDKIVTNDVSVESGRIWVVMFYAHWSPECTRFFPTWEDLIAEVQKPDSLIKFGSIDFVVHVEQRERFGVRAYPTLVLFSKNRMHRYRDSDLSKAAVLKWIRGGYLTTAPEPIPAAGQKAQDPDQPGTLTDPSFDSLVQMGFPRPWLVVFIAGEEPTDRAALALTEQLPLLNSRLSSLGVSVGVADHTASAAKAAQRLGVHPESALSAVLISEATFVAYQGIDWSASALVEFARPRGTATQTAAKPFDWDPPQSVVLKLDDAAARRDVLVSNSPAGTGRHSGDWFIFVGSRNCRDCTELRPLWEFVARTMRGGRVRVAEVDGTQQAETAFRLGVTRFPALVLVMDGPRGREYRHYPFRYARLPEFLLKFAYKQGEQWEDSVARKVRPDDAISRIVGVFMPLYNQLASVLLQDLGLSPAGAAFTVGGVASAFLSLLAFRLFAAE